MDRGADDEVVEVEEEPALRAEQEVAHVAVAVDAVDRNAPTPLRVDRGHLLDGAAVALRALCGQEAAVFEER